jgi:hypothetical protein
MKACNLLLNCCPIKQSSAAEVLDISLAAVIPDGILTSLGAPESTVLAVELEVADEDAVFIDDSAILSS